jgi:hypothetical protein
VGILVHAHARLDPVMAQWTVGQLQLEPTSCQRFNSSSGAVLKPDNSCACDSARTYALIP